MNTNEQGCVAQTYWYEEGVQRGEFCSKQATRLIRGGGVNHPVCVEHAEKMLGAGATDVTPGGDVQRELGE